MSLLNYLKRDPGRPVFVKSMTTEAGLKKYAEAGESGSITLEYEATQAPTGVSQVPAQPIASGDALEIQSPDRTHGGYLYTYDTLFS